LPQVKKVGVWGCGNFECWWPHQLFGNRRAEREGRLEVHPWADERSAREQRRRGAIRRENWRTHFQTFVRQLQGASVYVTIDLDCLRRADAITNWENGRFTLDDLEWALRLLRNESEIIAGDICGAYSPPVYARAKQRFAAGVDHPKLQLPSAPEIERINHSALAKLWPLLA
jgi:hypothetical protein